MIGTFLGLPVALVGGPAGAAIGGIVGAIGGVVLQTAYDKTKADGSLALASGASLNMPADATVGDLLQAAGTAPSPQASLPLDDHNPDAPPASPDAPDASQPAALGTSATPAAVPIFQPSTRS